MKIAIAITTHNRNDVLDKSLEYFKKYKSKDSDIIIVDDASTIPYPNSDYYFTENVGISVAKNKCIELTQNYDYIFLFDSDCYPIKAGFEKAYIDSGLEHAMYIFTDFANGSKLNDTSIIRRNDKYIEYSHPRGCMMFYSRKALDLAGGMRPQLQRWGYEHGELSDRIFNLNLAPSPYCDIVNSSEYIYSLDEHLEVKSTTEGIDRRKCITANKRVYDDLFGNTDKVDINISKGRNVILTAYYTGVEDPQRKTNFKADIGQIKALQDSVKDYELIIFNDCFDFGVKSKVVDNPYFQRWIDYREWLINNEDVNYVWLVDATDVELLKNPFNIHKDILYVGYENDVLLNSWLIRNSKADTNMKKFFSANSQLQLLNCGVIGGHRDIILELLNKYLTYYYLNYEKRSHVDMPLFNYIMYKYFQGRFVTGKQIVTQFKKNEYNDVSIWKHK